MLSVQASVKVSKLLIITVCIQQIQVVKGILKQAVTYIKCCGIFMMALSFLRQALHAGCLCMDLIIFILQSIVCSLKIKLHLRLKSYLFQICRLSFYKNDTECKNEFKGRGQKGMFYSLQ